jgi:hypothetical protein
MKTVFKKHRICIEADQNGLTRCALGFRPLEVVHKIMQSECGEENVTPIENGKFYVDTEVPDFCYDYVTTNNPDIIQVEKIPQEVFENLEKVTDRVNYVIMMMRINAVLFVTKLEYEHFKPGTVKNKDFLLFDFMWQGLAFIVISIPIRDMEKAYIVAKETGLRIADGIPRMFGGGENTSFPLKSKNIMKISFMNQKSRTI